jgi:hypothetical protein
MCFNGRYPQPFLLLMPIFSKLIKASSICIGKACEDGREIKKLLKSRDKIDNYVIYLDLDKSRFNLKDILFIFT